MMNNQWKIIAFVAAAVAVVVLAGLAVHFDRQYVQNPSDLGTRPHVHEYEETVREANCTEAGSKLFTCSCGDSYQELLQEALGHKYDEWVSVQEPTADSEGIRQRKCKRCEVVEEESYTTWLLTYEEYMALTPEEQQAYYETFEDFNAYFAWLNKAKEEYENNKEQIEIGGGGSLDLGDIIGGKD